MNNLETINQEYSKLTGNGQALINTVYQEDKTMNKLNRQELNEELINRGIVFDADFEDEFEVRACLENIYDWGFTTVSYCTVLDPVMTFYDWKYQAICNIDLDNYTEYTLEDGHLHVKERKMFSENDYFEFNYDLNNGAPIHIQDIAAIWYDDGIDFPDTRFYELKDGRIFYKESGQPIKLVDSNAFDEDITYVAVSQDALQSNVDILNNLLVWENIR